MAIQVDNPLNVLSQDSARQFLNATTPEDKYKFFLKGTQLAQLQLDHEIIRAGLDTTRSVIGHKKQLLPDLLKEAKEWERKYKDMQSARDLAVKLERLKHEMAWAQVQEAEEQCDVAHKRMTRTQQKLPSLDAKRAEEQATMEAIQAKVADVEVRMDELTQRRAPLQSEREALVTQSRELQAQINQIQADERELDREVKGLRRRHQDVSALLDQEQQKAEADLNAMRQEKQAQISACQDRIATHEATLAEADQEFMRLRDASQKAQALQDDLQSQLDQRYQRIKDAKATIQNLQRQKQNHMTSFGPTMPDVLRSIAAETRWQSAPPLGPLGLYVKLKHPQWADTLESILNQVLNAFIVESHHDQRLLAQICQRHRCRSRIYVSKLEAFDYSHGEPDSQFLTILRALEFTNDMVRYQLINSNRIEQTILIEQRTEADRVMSSRRGQFPHNVIACFTVDGFQVGHKSGFSTMALNSYRGPPRFTRNIDALIDRHSRDLAALDVLQQDQNAALAQARDDCRLVQRKLQQHQQNVRGLHGTIREQRARIDQLHEELQDLEPANIQALTAEQQDLEKRIDLVKRQFAALHQQLVPLNEQMAHLDAQQVGLDQQAQQVQDALAKQQQIADRLMTQRLHQEQRIAHWDAKRTEVEQRLVAAEEEVHKLRANVATVMAKATEYAPERVQVTHTAQQLDQEIGTIELRLRETERIHGVNLEEIAQETAKRTEAYQRAKRDVLAMETFVGELAQALEVRTAKWLQFRDSIALRAKANFLYYLLQRGYTGRLEIDHQAQRLNPRVQTEDKAALAPTKVRHGTALVQRDKDPKSLSGGEKSFSTICLLLALWESMGCPIRCLDEFDVFMDAVNRRISMTMMIESARRATDTQYILITPQDMSSVSLGPDVRVHRLADPDRRTVT
ncbi:Structural maintenance of chromosomes protein 6 [Dimargaris xerosporica]|nr:Structural maintenance of chromosomes protein 6 [Dimargaris xerosporica]